jgi:hypothetical protein
MPAHPESGGAAAAPRTGLEPRGEIDAAVARSRRGLRPAWIVAAVLAVLLAAMAATLEETKALERAQRFGPLRLLQDTYDRGVYWTRGRWLPERKDPFLDLGSEYPQVATYFFAIPFLATGDEGPFEENRDRYAANRATYDRIFVLLMAALLVSLVPVTEAIAARLGLPAGRALLLLLPGTVYFALNRYDVLPTLLASASLGALVTGRPAWSGAALGLSVLSKWYAVLFAPAYLRYAWKRSGPRGGLAFASALGGVVATLLATTLLAWGPDSLLAPYRYHLGRDDNLSSAFHLLFRVLNPVPVDSLEPWKAAFLALQLLPFAAGFVVPLRSGRDLASFSLAASLVFVLFAKFFSPQWIVWITALALVAMRRPTDLFLLAALDAATYLQFTVFFQIAPGGPGFHAVVGLRVLLTIGLLVRCVMDWMRREPEPPGAGAAPPAGATT